MAFFCAVCMALAVCFMPQSAFADEGQAQQDQAADVQQDAAAADDQAGADQAEGVLPDQVDDQAVEGEDADASDPDQVAAAEDSADVADSDADADSADVEDTASDTIDEPVADSVKDTVAEVGTGLVDDDPLPSNTGQSDSMKYYHADASHWGVDAYDIQGIDGSGNAIQTTFANQGYHSSISVNGAKSDVSITQLGKVYEVNGIQIKLNITIAPNGESVYYTYTLYNTNADAATIQIGNWTDVQIGDNDRAAVTISGGGKKISMTNDDTSSSTYGMKYTLVADPDGEPFTGVWDGRYSYASSNVFSTMEDGTLTGTDSGLAFHWDFSLASGEMATRTAVFNISPALKVTDVTLTADASTGKLNMTIPFTDAENRTQTLYYTLEGADQQTATTSTGEGVESGEFDVNTDVPASWTAGNTYTVTLYVKDNVGYTSKTYTYYVYWPGSDDPTKTYNTLSFENTSTAFAHVRDVQGTEVVLPTDPGRLDGKRFLKWNTSLDGGGTDYEAGATYVLAADATLYAQWAYSLEDAVISAIADQVYDGTAKTPGATVTLYGNVLTEGTDYEVEYPGDNVNCGMAFATFKGLGAYIGAHAKIFNIIPADLADVSVAQTDSHTYDAEAYTAAVSASATSKGGQAVGFFYYLDDPASATSEVPSFTDAGEYVVHYIACAANHNDATGTFKIAISPKEATVTANDASKAYGQTDPSFSATVAGTLNGDSLEYAIYRESGEDVGSYAIAPMGEAVQGNYSVTFENGTLVIEPAQASAFEITAEGGDELVYNGSEQGPAFAVTCDGRTLVEGTDYTVSGATATKIGSYAAAFTGIGNYSGTAELPWSIVAPSHENGQSEGTEDDPENDKALDDTYESIMDEVSETGDVPSNVKETAEGAVKAAIAAGDSFITEVRAVQVTKQAESDVPAADKNLVAIAVQSLASEGTPELVEYIDISVLLKNARTDEILAYITQTDSPIRFAIQLDADIASQLAGKAVYLVRTHDGESTFIDAVLGEDGILRFSSDLFSTYAIASVEAAEPEPDNGNGDGAQACAQAASCSDGSASPKTGDSLPAAPIAGIALAAAAALAAASRRRAER